MQLDVKVPVAGKHGGLRFAFPVGRHEVPDEVAAMLIKAGHAEKVKTPRRGKSSSRTSEKSEE